MIQGLEISDSLDTLQKYENMLHIQADREKSIFILPTISTNSIYFEKHFVEFRDVLNINYPNSFTVLSSDEIQILSLNHRTHILPKVLLRDIAIGIIVNIISSYITTYSVQPNDNIKLEMVIVDGTKEKQIKYDGSVKNLPQVFTEVEKLFEKETNVASAKQKNHKQ
jgi:hypothetical protein